MISMSKVVELLGTRISYYHEKFGIAEGWKGITVAPTIFR